MQNNISRGVFKKNAKKFGIKKKNNMQIYLIL